MIEQARFSTTNLTLRLWNWADSVRTREEGQTMAEYGVVLGVITVAAVGAFVVLGGRVNDVIRDIVTRF